jgi:hypothetical protein
MTLLRDARHKLYQNLRSETCDLAIIGVLVLNRALPSLLLTGLSTSSYESIAGPSSVLQQTSC